MRITNKSYARVVNSVDYPVCVTSTENTLGVRFSTNRNGRDGSTLELVIPTNDAGSAYDGAEVTISGRQARALLTLLQRAFATTTKARRPRATARKR